MVNVHEAKTKLSKLLARAQKGEEIIIARNGQPAVKLVPVGGARPKAKKTVPRFGFLKGKIRVSAAFNKPMSPADLAEWDDAPITPA